MLINLTPHPIVVFDPKSCVFDHAKRRLRLRTDVTPNVIKRLPGTRWPARCKSRFEETGEVGGIPVLQSQLQEIVNLPREKAGVTLVVSAHALFGAKEQGRTDCACPSRLVCDETGQIVGCTAFAK